MLEVIETCSSRYGYFGVYEKAWVVLLENEGRLYKVMVMASKTTFPLPVSKKRWRLKNRFLKEGCLAWLSFRPTPIKEGRKIYWLTPDEIIKIGKITEGYLINELKEADKRAKADIKI